MSDYGKRSRMTPTRGGLVREIFYVCYSCPAELEEGQLASHNCQEEAAVSLIAWVFCPLCEEALERGEACGIARHNLEHEEEASA